MVVSGQKRGSSVHVQLHDDMKNVTNVAELKDVEMKDVKMEVSRKSDRQGLNILDPVTFRQDTDLGYEEELPLPEYRPQVTILGCDWLRLGDTDR